MWHLEFTAWAVCQHVRISSYVFLPCDVTYAISEPRPSAILSHEGQRSHLNSLEQRAWERGYRFSLYMTKYTRVEALPTRQVTFGKVNLLVFSVFSNIADGFSYYIGTESPAVPGFSSPRTSAKNLLVKFKAIRMQCICCNNVKGVASWLVAKI